MSNAFAPMNLANQHFVTYTTGDGKTETAPVYATSLEAAVESIRALFEDAKDMGAPYTLTECRPASEAELPWKQYHWFVAEKGAEKCIENFSAESTVAECLEIMGWSHDGFSIRPATPAEAEESYRTSQLWRDERDAEDFDMGFQQAKEAALFH